MRHEATKKIGRLAFGLAAAMLLFGGCAATPPPPSTGPSLPPVELAAAPAAPVQHDELDDGLDWIVSEAEKVALSPAAPSTYDEPLRLDPVPVPAPKPAAPEPLEQLSHRN